MKPKFMWFQCRDHVVVKGWCLALQFLKLHRKRKWMTKSSPLLRISIFDDFSWPWHLCPRINVHTPPQNINTDPRSDGGPLGRTLSDCVWSAYVVWSAGRPLLRANLWSSPPRPPCLNLRRAHDREGNGLGQRCGHTDNSDWGGRVRGRMNKFRGRRKNLFENCGDVIKTHQGNSLSRTRIIWRETRFENYGIRGENHGRI